MVEPKELGSLIQPVKVIPEPRQARFIPPCKATATKRLLPRRNNAKRGIYCGAERHQRGPGGRHLPPGRYREHGKTARAKEREAVPPQAIRRSPHPFGGPQPFGLGSVKV